jgi:drebrin-like protein
LILTQKSAYQPTKVDMNALRAGKSDTTSGPSNASSALEIVKSNYTPIGRPDLAAIRAQAKETSPSESRDSSYKGTTGYTPVSLPKPKPLGGTPKFGPSVTRGGTTAPMPIAPVRESKAIGGASKNFGTDASGKTPSQLWAERKAREKGLAPGNVIPPVAPASPLPTGKPPPSPSQFVQDSSDVIGKPVSGGVKAMRERFARQSLDDDQPPISPGGGMRPKASASPTMSSPQAPSLPYAPSPPPIALTSKPPPSKTYQSLDHVVAAGAGAGVGLGVGAIAAKALKDEPDMEPDDEVAGPPSPPPMEPQQETWDTTQTAEEEDEEDLAVRQRSQIHAQQFEPEPETYEPVHEEPSHHEELNTASATGGKSAVVLFDYEAQEENEISLIEGQLITNVEIIDEVHISNECVNVRDGGQERIRKVTLDYSLRITSRCKITLLIFLRSH